MRDHPDDIHDDCMTLHSWSRGYRPRMPMSGTGKCLLALLQLHHEPHFFFCCFHAKVCISWQYLMFCRRIWHALELKPGVG